jgi:hypothetical protein
MFFLRAGSMVYPADGYLRKGFVNLMISGCNDFRG